VTPVLKCDTKNRHFDLHAYIIGDKENNNKSILKGREVIKRS